MSDLLTFKNENPTPAERELYLYAGFYPIELHLTDDGGVKYVQYAECNTDENQRKEYPAEISILKKYVNKKQTITFSSEAELVYINGLADTKILSLIMERTKELGWK